jgi:hypothetical protein
VGTSTRNVNYLSHFSRLLRAYWAHRGRGDYVYNKSVRNVGGMGRFRQCG